MNKISLIIELLPAKAELIGTPNKVFAEYARMQAILVEQGFPEECLRFQAPTIISSDIEDFDTTNHELDTPIEELGLVGRPYTCLKRAGLDTVWDLVAKSEGELSAIPNLGQKSIKVIIEKLRERGLKLRDG